MKKVRLPSFLIGVASLFGSRLILLVLNFLSGVLIARLLGPEKEGVLTTAVVIPGLILSFANLGLMQVATYFLGQRLYDDQAVISTVMWLTLLTSVLSIGGVFLVYQIMAFHQLYGWDVLVLSLGLIPTGLIVNYCYGILFAKRQVHKVAIASILAEFAFCVFAVWFFVINIDQIVLVLLARVLCTLIPAGYVLLMVRKYGDLTPRYVPRLPWEMVKKGSAYAIALFILGLNYRVDVILLGRMTNPVEVGIYSVGVRWAELLWMLPSALTMVNFSYSATAQDDLESAQKTAKILRMTLWLAVPPLFFLYVISPNIIPWIYTNQFAASSSVIQAILPGVWMMLIVKVLNSDLSGRGRPGMALWVFVCALIINVFLNIWWAPLFGSVGSAWASTLSYTTAAVLFAVRYTQVSRLKLSELFMLRKDDIQSFRSIFVRP